MQTAPVAPVGAGNRLRRHVVYYALVGGLTAAAFVAAFSLGAMLRPEPGFAGVFALPAQTGAAGAGSAQQCLGSGFIVQQSGSFATVDPARAGSPSSPMRIDADRLSGRLTCLDGAVRPFRARLAPPGRAPPGASSPPRALMLVVGGQSATATDTGMPVPAAGTRPVPPTSLSGTYAAAAPSACLGTSITITAAGQARFAIRNGPVALGVLHYLAAAGIVTGRLRCPRGSALVHGTAAGRGITLTGTGAITGSVVLGLQRQSEDLFAAFFVAVALVMLLAQLGGVAMARIGQPRVMGEVLAGILLGPTLLGALAPHLEAALFPADVVPILTVAANFGLVFYMFLIGLELDLGALKGRVAQTLTISNTSVALPMALGVLVAVPLYRLLGTHKSFAAFALFMGVSMSITAFPVLARILTERRMLDVPLGTLAIASAAIDDITAWTLIAVATAAAGGGAAGLGVGVTILLTVAFAAAMAFAVRPVLGRAATAFGESGRVPAGWIVAIFAGVLLSAYVTEHIGVAIIFGAFVMGAVMPRHAGLTEDVTGRLDSFVATVLLPLFFVSTGLSTNLLLLDRPELVLITLALCGVAIAGKFGGTLLAARFEGLGWRDASVLGTLLNTRGLTELIVLNLALQNGVISEALFGALVVMALVTTFMTGPLLSWLDRDSSLRVDAADALEAVLGAAPATQPPRQRILVAPDSASGLDRLLAVAEPLARSEPPRELVIVRLLTPTAGAEVRGGLQTERRALGEASAALRRRRGALAARGVAARGAAMTSTDPGTDIARLADREAVDLVLLDGRRPLVGSAIPGGPIRDVLARAAPDVVVLVSSEQHRLPPAPGAPIVVPFGGAAHDWAAVELGAWLSAALDAPLVLVGAAHAASAEGPGEDASRLLANATLMLQRFYGVEAQPVIGEPGAAGVLQACAGAGLIVVGLSDRWQEEGLGDTRAQLARGASAPILFVRRGSRRGALAGRDDVTRFTWSSPGSARGAP